MFDVFSTPVSPIADQDIREVLATAWGLTDIRWSAFGSERDDTLRIWSGDDAYVLKVSHPLDDPSRLHRQLSLMNFVGQKHLPLATQTAVSTVTGELTAAVTTRLAHLLPFLPGTPIRSEPQGEVGVRAIGAALWQVQQALADYPKPYDTDHTWALACLATAQARTDVMTPGGLREGCEALLRHAIIHSVPRLAELPAYPTHNDAHTDNVLVDGQQVVGLVDWGDSITQPRVADLAVAASYARSYHPMWQEGDPWRAATTLRRGYVDAGGPEDHEDFFGELVLARLVQRIVLNLSIAARALDGGAYARRNMVNSVRDVEELFETRPEGVFPGLGTDPLW